MVSLTTVTTTRSSRRIHVTDSRSLWMRLDWAVVGTAAALLAIGSILVWSATGSNDALTGGDPTAWADAIREVVAFFGTHLGTRAQ